MKMYWTVGNVCSVRPFRNECTTNRTRGRTIERWEHKDVVGELRQKAKTKEGLAKLQKRKELCEHPFGTIKKAFNQGYLLLKGLRKVSGEVGFTVLACNLRRAINILGTEALVAAIN